MATKKHSPRDVETLATFLVDRNPATVDLAKEQLKALLHANPGFRKVLESSSDPQIAHEAQVFLEETRLQELYEAFERLARKGKIPDLEQGCFLLAKLAFPALWPSDISRPLQQMAEEIRARLEDPASTAARQVECLRRYLFDEQGFQGNERNYYDPDNSFINRVLERRIGIPISLSCIYLLVAWRLGMPAQGIGLPGHFVIGHGRKPGMIYIDAFHGGRLLTRNDCIELVRQRGMAFQDAFLEPTPHRQILARMIVNVTNIYTERGAADRARWLEKVLTLFQEEHP